MADGLTTISTEHLTAAVTSLFQKPLPDSHILPPHGSTVHAINTSTRRDIHTLQCLPVLQRHQDTVTSSTGTDIPRDGVISVSGASSIVPIVTSASQITPPLLYQAIRQPAQLSQMGHQFNGKQVVQSHNQQNLTPQQTSVSEPHNVQNSSKLKFSVDNLHLASAQTSSATNNQSLDSQSFSGLNLERLGLSLPESGNNGSLLNNISVLQNLLNNHIPNQSNINNSMIFANPKPPVTISDNNHASSFHQLSPTQPLQNLIHSLFPQYDQTSSSNPSQNSNEIVPQSLPSSESISVPSSVVQDLCKTKPLDTSQVAEFLKSQEVSLIQKIQQNDVSMVLDLNPKVSLQTDTSHGVLGSSPGSLPTIQDLQKLVKGSAPAPIQQFPFLLQSSMPGGPLQLVPLVPGLDLASLQALQQQLSKTSVVSSTPPVPVINPPVSIQPKPSYLNLAGAQQGPQSVAAPDTQISTSSASVPNSMVLDVNMIQHLLNNHAGNKEVDSSGTKTSVHETLSHPTTTDFIAHKLCQDLGPEPRSQVYTTPTNDDGGVLHPEHNLQLQAAVENGNPVADCGEGDTSIRTDASLHEMSNMTQQTDMGGIAADNCDTMMLEQPQVQLDNNRDVFCIDCNKLVKGKCRVHDTEYAHVFDTPILTRAHASLPQCFYLHQTSTTELKDVVLGVWCKECVSERTKFGPVVSDRKSIKTSDYQQQTDGFNPYKISGDTDNTEVLIMVEENVCNWMMFVRNAHSLMEQNCVMYKDGEEFFIITKTEIKEDEELLMWYSSEICQQMGISQNPGIAKLLQCGVCVTYFTSKKLRNAHLRSAHPDRYKWTCACPMCGKKFSANSKLNNHMMSHMGMKPHSCSYCGKQFSDPSNLKTHMHIHTGEKKFRCELCNKTFRQKAHLDTHVITHTGDKNHTCKYCNQSFARRSDMKTHTYRHTQELTYTCNTCGKVFYKTQNYKKHLKVHTGERNYMCNKCFKGFQTKYHRDRHLKICKEKNGKESSYMSLEEVAKLDNTCDVVPLKTVKADDGTSEHSHNDNDNDAPSGYYR